MTRQAFMGVAFAIGAAALAGAQEVVPRWPAERGGPQRTAHLDVPTFGTAAAHTGMAWAVALGTPVAGAVVIDDGQVFVADTAGRVHAFDWLTGCPRWQTAVGEPVVATPAAGPAGLAVAGRAGTVRVLARDGGAERWRATLPGGVDAAPLWWKGRLFVADRTGRLSAFEAASGREVWTAELGTPIFAAPAAAGDRVIVVTAHGVCSARGIADGTELWSQRIGGGPCYATPAVAGGRVYTVAGDGTCASWRLDGGRRVFRLALDGPASASPAVRDGRLFVIAEGGDCRAIDAADGRDLWTETLDSAGRFRAGLVAGPTWVLATASDGKIRLKGATEAWRGRSLNPAVGGPRPMLHPPALHADGCVGVRADGLVFAQREPAGDARVVSALLRLDPPTDAVTLALLARRLPGTGGAAAALTICRSGETAYDVLDEIASGGQSGMREPAARWRDHLSYVTAWIRRLRASLGKRSAESTLTWRVRRRRLWKLFLVHPQAEVAAAAVARYREDGGRLSDFDPLWPVAKRRTVVAELPD